MPGKSALSHWQSPACPTGLPVSLHKDQNSPSTYNCFLMCRNPLHSYKQGPWSYYLFGIDKLLLSLRADEKSWSEDEAKLCDNSHPNTHTHIENVMETTFSSKISGTKGISFLVLLAVTHRNGTTKDSSDFNMSWRMIKYHYLRLWLSSPQNPLSYLVSEASKHYNTQKSHGESAPWIQMFLLKASLAVCGRAVSSSVLETNTNDVFRRVDKDHSRELLWPID